MEATTLLWNRLNLTLDAKGSIRILDGGYKRGTAMMRPSDLPNAYRTMSTTVNQESMTGTVCVSTVCRVLYFKFAALGSSRTATRKLSEFSMSSCGDQMPSERRLVIRVKRDVSAACNRWTCAFEHRRLGPPASIDI